MSSFIKVTKKCAVCGKEQVVAVVKSTNAIGYMDLDTRPPQDKRGVLPYEIQFCSNCGYANEDLATLVCDDINGVISLPEYQNIFNNNAINKTAKAFMLSALISQKNNVLDRAGLLYLKAAWIFDDLNQENESQKARSKAIECLSEYVEQSENLDNAVMVVDLLRRIGNFKDAKETAMQLLDFGINSLLTKILQYEVKLCDRKDAECHTVEELD